MDAITDAVATVDVDAAAAASEILAAAMTAASVAETIAVY